MIKSNYILSRFEESMSFINSLKSLNVGFKDLFSGSGSLKSLGTVGSGNLEGSEAVNSGDLEGLRTLEFISSGSLEGLGTSRFTGFGELILSSIFSRSNDTIFSIEF